MGEDKTLSAEELADRLRDLQQHAGLKTFAEHSVITDAIKFISAQSAAIKAGEEKLALRQTGADYYKSAYDELWKRYEGLRALLEAPSDEVVNAVADAIQKEGEMYAIIPGYAYARLARAALSALNKAGLET